MQNISSVTAYINRKRTIAELRRAVLKKFDETIEGASTEGALRAVDEIQVELKISWVRSEPTPTPTGEALDALLAKPITELGLLIQEVNCLHMGGYWIIGDVVRKRIGDFGASCRFGDVRRRNLHTRLLTVGLQFELKTPVGPLERRAVLDGRFWPYLCENYFKDRYCIRFERDGIRNLGDLLQAGDEKISTILLDMQRNTRTHLEDMHTRLRERGLIE
jgi:hypothetical protein